MTEQQSDVLAVVVVLITSVAFFLGLPWLVRLFYLLGRLVIWYARYWERVAGDRRR